MDLLVVLGPTGTGKSEVAQRVAESVGGEIVGCDALQVYAEFDTATAKPTPAARARIPHHLVDVADPRADFSLAEYVRLADAAIAAVHERGRVPLIVGGTGMYLRGLLRGVVPAPARDSDLRARLRAMAARYGAPRLHRWLATLDPSSAERVAPADVQRVIRGLEVALSGAEPWSETLRREGTWAGRVERYRSLKVGLDCARERLNRRLDERVDAFFDAGLAAEVRRLLDRGVPEAANAFKAIGYREVLRALRAGAAPDSVREEVKRNTRRYAKRQRTWYRGEPGVVWLDAAEAPDALARRVFELWSARGL